MGVATEIKAAGEAAVPVRYAGVDWSWSEHAVCVVDESGSVVERLTVKHSGPGLARLVTGLHRHRARHDLVAARVAAHNQLRAHLLSAFPGVVGLFHRLDGGISLTFLTRFPTPHQARWLSETLLAAWLSAAKYTRAKTRTPEQLMAHPRQSPPGLADGGSADAGEVITLQLVALLQSLKERISVLEQQIAQALAAHADEQVFTSLPHSGTVRAATLLAEIGDPRGRFPTEEALAAAAGVSPSTRASGRARAVVFRRGCNRRLRQTLVDFADGSRRGSPWAQAIYERARARGARHAHAIRVLARAWSRVIWRCWIEGTPYQPERHGGLLELQQAAEPAGTPLPATT